MKKLYNLFLVISFLFTITACGQLDEYPSVSATPELIESSETDIEPDTPIPTNNAAQDESVDEQDDALGIESEQNIVTSLPDNEQNEIQEAVSIPVSIVSDLVVHFLDVGQADSILIQLPNGQSMLIDGGESRNANYILNYIRSFNITTIDYLVATHPHADHIGGLPTIINALDIGEIYMPRVSHNTQTFENLLIAIEENDLQINTAQAGVNILTIPDLQIDIIAPVLNNYQNLNDHSAVIKISYGSTGFIFMGDAEALSESHITANVSADVIKIGHHGSNTSTSENFLNSVSPAYAVITVGINNSYGHPTNELLSRLDDAGISVYRTDLQGTIVITSNGEEITINTEPSPYQSISNTPEPTPTPAPTPTSTPEPIPEPTPSSTASPTMVWLSATGSRYHRINNCGNMNPSRARQVTLEVARANHDPCRNCNPPR